MIKDIKLSGIIADNAQSDGSTLEFLAPLIPADLLGLEHLQFLVVLVDLLVLVQHRQGLYHL